MHPLEKLAEELGSELEPEYKSAGQSIRQALASLWHPFDPDDEGTWPAIHDGISTVHQVTFDDNTVGVGYLIAHSGNWQTWTYRERRSVTHYTELLPGPRAEKTNGCEELGCAGEGNAT